MKKFFIVTIIEGKSGYGTGKLFLVDADGVQHKVSVKQANHAGIDLTFKGIVMLEEESYKKGDVYLDSEEIEQEYQGDGTKVTNIIPVLRASDEMVAKALLGI